MALGKEWNRYLQLVKERPEAFTDDDELPIILDEHVIDEFEQQSGRKIGVVYESPYRIMVVDLVRENGEYRAYERLLAVNSGAVVIVPRYRGKLLLLRQYRHALRKEQYAFPRGFGEEGISSEENAKKELAEELDLVPEQMHGLTYLGQVVPDSGLGGDGADVFGCEVDGWNIRKNYEGILDVVLLSEEELLHWIDSGKLTDAFTLSAFCLYRSRKLTGTDPCKLSDGTLREA